MNFELPKTEEEIEFRCADIFIVKLLLNAGKLICCFYLFLVNLILQAISNLSSLTLHLRETA